MKKIFIIMLFTACSIITFSQSIGFYLGGNLMNLKSTSPDMSSNMGIGYQAGAFYRIGSILYGQGGLEYQLLQNSYTIDNGVDAPLEGNVNCQILKMPLYAGVKLLALRIYAGPEFGYVLNVPDNNLDFTKGDFNTFRTDGTIGAGLDFLLLSLDAGYTFGMNNLFSDYDGKANYVFINAGIKF